MDCLIVGCGLTGSVIGRKLADRGKKVVIWERRNHIGGNMYDYTDKHGIIVHKYGPHIFHTNKRALFDFMCRFSKWKSYCLACGSVIDGIETPMPFNLKTIDQFYSREKAVELKKRIEAVYKNRSTITVLEALDCQDDMIKEYTRWLFEKDYGPYTAKQWGISPDLIDKSILERVPLRLSYEEGYFNDKYQIMPEISYSNFFQALLKHPNIYVETDIDALDKLKIDDGRLFLNNAAVQFPVVYTGALDELFNCRIGRLPYRSLYFEWKHENIDSKQLYPVVAYPAAKRFTRITEYKKLPAQNVKGTSYAIEYPLKYDNKNTEPYYPILTEESKAQYNRYRMMAENIPDLYICGRLAEFKYYNMDQALARALEISDTIIKQNR